MKEASFFRVGETQSCLLIHSHRHSRGKDRKQQPQGVCWLVEEQSSCKGIQSVYLVWLWMLTETTADSTGLQSSPCMFEQTLTWSIHLCFPQAELDLLGLQKTCEMRCKEGTPYTELQYQGS